MKGEKRESRHEPLTSGGLHLIPTCLRVGPEHRKSETEVRLIEYEGEVGTEQKGLL